MTKGGENQGEQQLITEGEPRPLSRLPNESDQAYATKLAYCKLPASKRSVTAAFRSVKNEPADSKHRAPGRYFTWAKRFDWTAAAADWDAYLVALPPAPVDVEKQAAIEEREVDQLEQLQDLIDRKTTELLAPPTKPAGVLGWLSRLLPGHREKKQAELDTINAAALESLTAAYNNLAGSRSAALIDRTPRLPAPAPD